LPWSDEGFRLLPAHFYFELTTKMREFEQAFAQQVEEFLAVYPHYIEQVRPELNGLFREEDYPSTDKLRNKFGVKLEVLPIPSGNDFRVTLSKEEQARVAREIDENVRQSLQKGTEDLWTRLKSVVAQMVERLNEPESRFHASLVTNIGELVDLLPRLNVNQDEELKVAKIHGGMPYQDREEQVEFFRRSTSDRAPLIWLPARSTISSLTRRMKWRLRASRGKAAKASGVDASLDRRSPVKKRGLFKNRKPHMRCVLAGRL
jgi:hypothetical protein